MPGANVRWHARRRARPRRIAIGTVSRGAGDREGCRHPETGHLRSRLRRKRCVSQGQIQEGDGSIPGHQARGPPEALGA
eukprot:10019867-Lingulodinium_polyedra.AAC.1